MRPHDQAPSPSAQATNDSTTSHSTPGRPMSTSTPLDHHSLIIPKMQGSHPTPRPSTIPFSSAHERLYHTSGDLQSTPVYLDPHRMSHTDHLSKFKGDSRPQDQAPTPSAQPTNDSTTPQVTPSRPLCSSSPIACPTLIIS